MPDKVYNPPTTPEELNLFYAHMSDPWIDEDGEKHLDHNISQERGPVYLTWLQVHSMFQIIKDNKEKDDLVFALKSRVLTDEEMGRVASLGIQLYIKYRQSTSNLSFSDFFSEKELNKLLNEDLLQQFRIKGEEAKIKSYAAPLP